MNFRFEEVLEILTGTPYTSKAYALLEPFADETSSVIMSRCDTPDIHMRLNPVVSAMIQSDWPAEMPRREHIVCEALGMRLDMTTGVVCVVVYVIRGVPGSARSSIAHYVNVIVKNGSVSYRRTGDADTSSEDGVDLPPATLRVKRPAPSPICRIEVEALDSGLLCGKEDVDWYARTRASRNRHFYPGNGKRSLVLRRDLSAIYSDLEHGFEFDELVISEDKEITLKVQKQYILKMKACEFVAGKATIEAATYDSDDE